MQGFVVTRVGDTRQLPFWVCRSRSNSPARCCVSRAQLIPDRLTNCHPTRSSLKPRINASGGIFSSPQPADDESRSDATHQPEPPSSLSDEDAVVAPEILGKKFSLEDVFYYINVAYFTVLLAGIFSGNKHLTRLSSLTNFVTAFFFASAAFTTFAATRWLNDIWFQLSDKKRRRDFRSLLKFSWSALFWFSFVLWYSVSPITDVALLEWTGTVGAICCLYGIALAGSSALMSGSWSLLGPPAAPRRFVSTGPYALLRHPQAFGNFLALIGFSLSSGAVAAATSFVVSFLLYTTSVVPQEEKMLERVYGLKYKHYAERTPPFAWALVLLLILEAVLIWRYGIGQLRPIEPAL